MKPPHPIGDGQHLARTVAPCWQELGPALEEIQDATPAGSYLACVVLKRSRTRGRRVTIKAIWHALGSE